MKTVIKNTGQNVNDHHAAGRREGRELGKGLVIKMVQDKITI